ncbi:MAG: hypothetical protein ACREAF_00195 [Nitrosopumilaceae archaeon]
MKTFVRKYYRCITCNLTFKDREGAFEHKNNSLHKLTTEYFPARRYDTFPSFESRSREKSLSEFLSSEPFQIGESSESTQKKERYVCLTCGLAFKIRDAAEEHRINSKHKVVRENYPISQTLTNFRTIEEIIGSNIDYTEFEQRMHRWAGN